MKKFAIAAVAALVSVSAFAAATYIGDSLIFANGIWYNNSGSADWTSGEQFVGADLGSAYASFELGAQLQIYDPQGAWWDGDTPAGAGDWMSYSIDGGAWVDINLANTGNMAGNNMLFEPGGTQWSPAVVDISALDPGQHSLSVYFGGENGVDGQFDGSKESPFTASFTKTIPEPATMSLLGLGALAMVIRRKLRK